MYNKCATLGWAWQRIWYTTTPLLAETVIFKQQEYNFSSHRELLVGTSFPAWACGEVSTKRAGV